MYDGPREIYIFYCDGCSKWFRSRQIVIYNIQNFTANKISWNQLTCDFNQKYLANTKNVRLGLVTGLFFLKNFASIGKTRFKISS